MSVSAQTLALLRGLPTRAVALTLGAVAAGVFVAGLATGSGRMTSFDADLGVPAVFSGALVVVAAWLLWVLAGSASLPARSRSASRLLAAALALLGVEQMLSFHERVDEGLGLSAAFGALPVLALVAAAILLVLLLPATRERAALLLGLLVWMGAVILDASGNGGGAVAGLLTLGAAPLLAVAALALVQRYRADPAATTPPPEVAMRDLLLRIDPALFGIGLTVAICAMLGVASLYHAGVISLQTFDLRSQQGLNQFSSVALLLAAGGLALLRGRLSRDPWWAWTLLGVAFLAMSVDDVLSFHHEIGEATGVRGQFLLFPIVLAAAAGWFGCVRLSRDPIRWMFLVAGFMWGLSQAIDIVKPEGYFHWWVLPEEALELLGSALFVTALLLAVQGTAPDLAEEDAGEALPEPKSAMASGGA